MIHLYPALKKNLRNLLILLLVCVAAYTLFLPGVTPAAALIIYLLGALLVLFSQASMASKVHAKQLELLYSKLEIEEFLKGYEPHLKLALKNQNLYLTVRMHIANAYCAQGRFDEAIAMLSSLSVAPSKKPEEALLTRFGLTSNLCYCYALKEDAEGMKPVLDELISLRKELEALQERKPKKKRRAFSTRFNEMCYELLTTGKADVAELKGWVMGNNQQLLRAQAALWVARAAVAAGDLKDAEDVLRQIIKVSPSIYPGKVAARMLSKLSNDKQLAKKQPSGQD